MTKDSLKLLMLQLVNGAATGWQCITPSLIQLGLQLCNVHITSSQSKLGDVSEVVYREMGELGRDVLLETIKADTEGARSSIMKGVTSIIISSSSQSTSISLPCELAISVLERTAVEV